MCKVFSGSENSDHSALCRAQKRVSEAEYQAFEGPLAEIIFAPDHYAAIGLDRSAELSDKDIDKAFRGASMRAHPDRNRKVRDSFDATAMSAELGPEELVIEERAESGLTAFPS